MKVTTKKSAVKKIVPQATAKAVVVTTPKTEKVVAITASKYKGATTGMRVMEYQDATFAANAKAMLSDEELAANWRVEFPNAVAFTPNHVTGARRDYNAGRHAKQTPKPAVALNQYLLIAGKRVLAASVVKAPAATNAATPAIAKAASAPAKAPTAKSTAKAVRRMAKAS